MDDIKKITKLITEDPDVEEEDDDELREPHPDPDLFDECPSCGSGYATITDEGEVACPEEGCPNFNTEYVDTIPMLFSQKDLPPRYTSLSRELARTHTYVGKPGVVVMYPLSIRKGIGGPESKLNDLDDRIARREEYAARWPERAGRWPMYHADKELVIEFDDAIEFDRHYVLFVKAKPQKYMTTKKPKFAGRYIFIERVWDPTKRRFGYYILTTWHKALTCTKAYIKKMKIGDEIVIDRQ